MVTGNELRAMAKSDSRNEDFNWETSLNYLSVN